MRMRRAPQVAGFGRRRLRAESSMGEGRNGAGCSEKALRAGSWAHRVTEGTGGRWGGSW